MTTHELVDHLASYGIRRLPSEELQVELDFARRELALADNPDMQDYLAKRVAALNRERERRRALRETPRTSAITVEFIQGLKARVDIRDIFNSMGILVIPNGTDREKYQCPAHPDWNPSGFIFKTDQHYHCFQCGAHGDVFDALMAFRGMTFLQAVDAVAGFLGVELPRAKPQASGKGCVAL